MSSSPRGRVFQPHREGQFLYRPNRFVVHVATSQGEVRAHCPNPGRLIELLTPGRRVFLERGETPGRKTPWTLVAAEYKGEILSLYSSRANQIAGDLVIPRLFPQARDIRGEYSHGGSRFDWHFFWKGREIFLEVKACTLIEEGVAMFPDAPSERASRHLRELAELEKPREGHVLFIVMNPQAEYFIPNHHTDPVFAQTLSEVQGKVDFHGVSVRCNAQGFLELVQEDLPIQTLPLETLRKNRGIYLIVLEIPEDLRIPVGALGNRDFPGGWYVYCGSAMGSLSSRVKRHLGKRKKKHWHIDYLSSKAKSLKGFPIYMGKNRECELAAGLRGFSQGEVPGFGSSDCRCPSHLFYFEEPVLPNRDFLTLLFRFRHRSCFEGLSLMPIRPV